MLDEPVSLTAGYAPDHDRPLAGYTALMSVFGALFGGGLFAAARHNGVPDRVGAGDIVLIGVATHKLARLIGKDKVTSPFRAPFTEFQEQSGHGEVEEKARGTGLRKSVGELVVCPHCLGQWIAGGFTVGLVAAPRTTRLLAGMWTAQTLADVAQLAYVAAEERV